MTIQYTQQTPIVRRIEELRMADRSLAAAWLGSHAYLHFIIDEFLADDPQAILYLTWLEDACLDTINNGKHIELHYGILEEVTYV